MADWIRSIFDSLAAPIRTLISEVAKRVSSVWGLLVSFFGSVRSKWRTLRANTIGIVNAAIRHAQAVLVTLKWLALVYIPRKIAQEAASIRTWAGNLIAGAIATARKLVSDAVTWAGQQLAKLLAALDAVRAWAIAQFNAVVSVLNQLARLVFTLLTSPERLALWLVGAMFSALLKFALDNAEKIGIALWSKRRTIVTGLVHLLEDVLVRIL